MVGRGACRQQQARDARRFTEREPGAEFGLDPGQLRCRAATQERTYAAWSVDLAPPTAARAPARLPDGNASEQGGEHASSMIMRGPPGAAAGAGPVKGAGLADLVLHEAQLQFVQQVLGLSKTKAEVGRAGR